MKYVALFAFMAILTLGSNSLCAQNSELTPEVMNKMLQFITAKGTDRDIPALFSSALGLTDTGQPWSTHQCAAVETTPPNVQHGFAVSVGTEQDIVLSRRPNGKITIYRAGRDGKVVTALTYNFQTGNLVMLDRVKAQKQLNVELMYWARNVDHLLSDK